MKKFSGIILSLIVVFGFVQTGMAQLADIPTPKRQAKRMTDVMARKLDLSTDQKQDVLALNLRLAEKETELIKNEELDFFDRLEKYKAIDTTRVEELKKVFTDQQYQKFHEFNHRTPSDMEKKQMKGDR
ncbi:MAG TPA: hypothetical protein VK074_08585 [Fodinibius sp.]|nr:hypothetical protein [Fodinibius sp.]